MNCQKLVLAPFFFLLFLVSPYLSHADQLNSEGLLCRVLDPDLQEQYRGVCVDGLANGIGVARGKFGAFYDGEFRNGAKHGRGTKIYSNGDAYTGDWKYDFREGEGTYVFGINSPWRGDRSHGDWVSDKRHGNGVYVFGPDEARMETQFFGGSPIGFAPPSLVQRQRAMKKLLPIIGIPGKRVCSVTTDGASPASPARGVVTDVVEDRIQVRIGALSSLPKDNFASNLRWDSITDWMPCD